MIDITFPENWDLLRHLSCPKQLLCGSLINRQMMLENNREG